MPLVIVYLKLTRVAYGLASERSWSADWEIPETGDIGKQVFGVGGHCGSQDNSTRVAAVRVKKRAVGAVLRMRNKLWSIQRLLRITSSSEVIPENSHPSFTNPFMAMFM
jgi:hypothetical protein